MTEDINEDPHDISPEVATFNVLRQRLIEKIGPAYKLYNSLKNDKDIGHDGFTRLSFDRFTSIYFEELKDLSGEKQFDKSIKDDNVVSVDLRTLKQKKDQTGD